MKKISNKNKKLAHKIVELEKNISMSENQKEFDLMNLIIDNKVSIIDMLEIDDYIQEKKLLTK